MTRMIKVTDEDIAQGVQRRASHCPIALALRHAAVHHKWSTALVSYTHIYLGLDSNGTPDWRLTPPEIVAWLKRYDDGGEVHPFEFDVDSLPAMTPGESARLSLALTESDT